jgi:3-methyladenine DNA glycosylase AlkD
MKHVDVIDALSKVANKEKAKNLSRFFKTGKGQYGEGDIFIGVMVPEQRKIAREFSNLSLPEIQKLLKSKVHEHRLTALLILVLQFESNNKLCKAKPCTKIAEFYLRNTKYINNWDLVDLSAILYKLAKSDNVWERRISIITTLYFIIKTFEFKDTIKISEILLSDKHNLIHKAIGWMLREVGKKDEGVLTQFLDKHIKNMPRTTLRYAIEKFPKTKRQKYLHKI